MNNIFLIITNDKITIDEKIKEIANKYKDSELVTYDLLEVPIENLIEDLDTYNFLTSNKIIIGKNAYFLSSNKTKIAIEHNLEKLEKYLTCPSKDNVLVLVSDNIDKRKKITATILKQATLIEELKDIDSVIKNRLNGYLMDNNTKKLLLEYCGNDHERVMNEIDKLKLFKMEDKKITEDDVRNIVMKSLDDNIFHLVDSFLTGNKKEAFILYQNFLLHGEQVVNIIRLVSNKIRLIYQVKVLLKDGNSDQAISKLLNVHEYPVKLARELSYKYTEDRLIENLERLAKIDLDIKSGKSNGEVEFETLLATI